MSDRTTYEEARACTQSHATDGGKGIRAVTDHAAGMQVSPRDSPLVPPDAASRPASLEAASTRAGGQMAMTPVCEKWRADSSGGRTQVAKGIMLGTRSTPLSPRPVDPRGQSSRGRQAPSSTQNEAAARRLGTRLTRTTRASSFSCTTARDPTPAPPRASSLFAHPVTRLPPLACHTSRSVLSLPFPSLSSQSLTT